MWLGNGDYVKVGIGATLLLALRQVGVFALLQLPIVAAAWGLRRTAARRAVLVCTVWALSAGVGVVSGLRFFGHYFQQVVPPLALAAAFGVAAAPKGTWLTARRLLVACGVWTIALWSLCLVPSLGIQRAPAALVHGIDASTGRSDRVLVWGRLPDASVAARRLPSGRFVHHAYLTGLWASGHGDPDPARDDPFAGRWHDFLDDLHREPPTLIVDASSIVDGWHHYPVTSTPLADLVRTCYRSAAAIDGLPAWRRTTVCR